MNSHVSQLGIQNSEKIAGKMAAVVGLVSVAITLPLSPIQAQTSYYYAGESQGEKILVDLSSINALSNNDAAFEYLQGDRTLSAQAHCTGADAWTTLEDQTTHYAQSQASQEMVRIVCGYLSQSDGSADTVTRRQPSELLPTSIEPSVPPVLPTPSALPTPIEPPTPSDSAVAIALEPYQAPDAIPTANTQQTALVYDPSSNVRATPNGQILCSIDTVSYINIYGRTGDWYNTDACGNAGLIHISQISFE